MVTSGWPAFWLKKGRETQVRHACRFVKGRASDERIHKDITTVFAERFDLSGDLG
jgi:hypothetical protein